MTPRTARNYLLYQLHSRLYSEFYIRGGESPAPWSGGGVVSSAAFVEALSAANTGTGCWDGGWEIQAVGPSEVAVRRGDLVLRSRSQDCQIPEGRSMEPGTKARLRFPKEMLGISPGYYMALGEQGDQPEEAQPLVRVYWNLRAEGAAIFVRTATSMLNEAGLPFKLKVLNDPNSYVRCDAAVVYGRKGDYPAVAGILGQVYAQVARYLKPGTPAFTKAVAPSVGVAEDPGDGESLGQNRCRILADGMIRAYEQRARSLDERLQIVTDCYAAESINLNQPYLNPGSSDFYTFPA
jgi:hypothetical protein